MNAISMIKQRGKAAAATAAGGFVVANPVLSIFLLGAAAAVYFTWRARRGY